MKNNLPVGGVILIVIGAYFFLNNFIDFDFFRSINWEYIWPLILVFIGVRIIQKKRQKEEEI